MKKEKRKKLEARGWKVASVSEFLELTPDEEKIIELRLALSRALKNKRIASNLTQEGFAKLLRSSQSRVAKMETGDRSVTLDLLFRSLFKAGVDSKEISKLIAV